MEGDLKKIFYLRTILVLQLRKDNRPVFISQVQRSRVGCGESQSLRFWWKETAFARICTSSCPSGLSCLLFCQSCASMLHLNVSLQRCNHHTVDLYAPPNPNCTPFAFQCFLWGNCSALLYPFHFKNGVLFPYLMPVAPHSYFYKALGMASAGSVLIKSMSSLSHPLPGSPDTSYQLIHCFRLSMKNLPKASGTVWGSCRTLRKNGLACRSRLLGRQP